LFATSVADTSGNLPPVSLTPVATGVVDTGGQPLAANTPRIFEKIRNGPTGILRGLGKLIHEKNQKQKIS
jgi:hypothetical protein